MHLDRVKYFCNYICEQNNMYYLFVICYIKGESQNKVPKKTRKETHVTFLSSKSNLNEQQLAYLFLSFWGTLFWDFPLCRFLLFFVWLCFEIVLIWHVCLFFVCSCSPSSCFCSFAFLFSFDLLLICRFLLFCFLGVLAVFNDHIGTPSHAEALAVRVLEFGSFVYDAKHTKTNPSIFQKVLGSLIWHRNRSAFDESFRNPVPKFL